MSIGARFAIGGIVFMLGAADLFAGGSGLNVVVVANQNSSNSLQLANYYCEKRGVPPQNVVRINWAGGNDIWSKSAFESTLLNPLLATLASRQLTNQIDYVVLSMDIPYRVTETNGANATTAALFYGFQSDGSANPPCLNCPLSCNLPAASSNSYAASEASFRSTPPGTALTNFLTVMLTSSNLAQAKAVVDRAVMSDGTFPTQMVYLVKGTDPARNVRYQSFDNAVFNTRLRGNYAMQRTNNSYPNGLSQLLGYQNGVQMMSLGTNAFLPGAMADNLTSYGGDIFRTSDHLLALAFLNAGAAGSFGTVVEPCNYLEKFPSPQNYFYQARGFSVGECYYQSLTNPYQGLIVGEPLAAPFARPCNGGWTDLPTGALLVGTTNLSAQFTAADASRPVQQVDLYVDGLFAQTLTNIPPRPDNLLSVTINGFPTNYTVATNDNLKSVASNLALRLNAADYTNATKIRAFEHGDRIELQSFDFSAPGTNVQVSVSNAPGPGEALTTYLQASGSNFLDSIAWGVRSFIIGVGVVTNDVLTLTVTKTNGSVVSTSITNYAEGVTLEQFLQTFVTAINSTPELQGDDGLVAEDLIQVAATYDQFNLRARTRGWDAAQIQVQITGSFDIFPPTNQRLDENLPDLQPRNHLYLTAGVTNLNLQFELGTTNYPDGWHELTAVAYEGSHVRTQKRIAQSVRIANTSLSAVFACLLCETNTALEATLQFSVAANTNTISRMELFSTGGSLGVVNNQQAAAFAVAATNLAAGLHPFYSVVTRTDGKQYRTETKWIRLLDTEPPFALAVAGSAPVLSWPATAGRRYEVLSATNATDAFLLRGAVVPTNSPGRWAETNRAAPSRSYRVRSAP